MNTLKEIKNKYINELVHLYDLHEINSLFQIAAEHILAIPKIQLALNYNKKLDQTPHDQFSIILDQLLTGQPIQYIIGSAPFYGLNFDLNEDTLIPRVETEELVDLIINQNKDKSDLNIIDIGTGSGCIAISIKKHLASAEVTAIDISASAIQIAKNNASNNGTPIDFRCIDILEWEVVFTNETYDIIVSNPPYITQVEKDNMHNNVLLFEPYAALFVEDEAPLLFYDYISSFALVHLKEGGKLFFEINQYLAQETKELLLKKGFNNVQILNDINGLPRMICAKIK